MQKIKTISLLAIIPLFFFSCEEEFIPEVSTSPDDIIVEGYIEAGDNANPPYVILTRSIPFFSEIEADVLENLFIHDAEVSITEGDRRIDLTELCFEDLTDQQRELAGQLLGLSADSVGLNFCVYLDLSFSLVGEIGKQYELEVNLPDKTITASTTIPEHIVIDSMQFVVPAGEVPDSLLELRIFMTDIAGQADFYRYFTRINSGALIPGYNSVTDDLFFDGQSFEFPLAKGEPRTEPIDPQTFGLFTIGDTARVKWCTIDEAHFNFWNTLEFNAINQGPFSSYTRIQSNINGGLGIWGGYAVSYYEKVVEEE